MIEEQKHTDWTLEMKSKWNDMYYRTLSLSMNVYLAKLPKERMPVLELSADEGAWTNNKIIHIGTGDLKITNEKEMMMWANFLLGHEIQHVLSTTDKAWKHGLDMGFKTICHVFSRIVEGRTRRFLKDSDYDRFLMDMKAKGYHISKDAVMYFVHFIVNSLEDGRIERIRCIRNPGYKNYIKYCRGKTWMDCGISQEMCESVSEPRMYLSIVLNQILTLATMSIYQKGFSDIAAKDTKTHQLVQSLIPHIRKAVSSPNCRGCMEEAVLICEMLAEEIVEACRYSQLEELIQNLIQQIKENQSFTADSRTEEMGDNGMLLELFGTSELAKETDKMQDSNAKSSGKDHQKESQRNGNLSMASNGQMKCSQDGQTMSTLEESAVEEAVQEADFDSREEIEISIRSGYQSKKSLPKQEVEMSKKDELPDLSMVAEEYGNKVRFEEMKRFYKPDCRMPAELTYRARNLKRKIEKIFMSREVPSLRGQNQGRIDAAKIYKLAMNQMDFFRKKQKSEKFEGCCYILLDNSGSMGNGSGSKRYYCCTAAAIIEEAFSPFMPLKLEAFTSYGCDRVEHTLIKNWHEKIHSNAAWNFYEKSRCQSGNKDGYSVKVAIKDILAQPERNKLLIVISDGLPSDYLRGYAEGAKDVQSAVLNAKKAGIHVIGILVDEDLREDQYTKVFREMYGTGSIISQPEEMEQVLVRELKRFCFK